MSLIPTKEQRRIYDDEQKAKYATRNSYYCCEAKSKEILVRDFLSRFVEFDTRYANFQTLFDKYKEKTNRCNLPTNEQDFYQYIFNCKLGLEKLPRETLTDLYFSAMQDINFINEELEKLEAIENDLKAKKNNKQRLNEEDFYFSEMVKHYKNKNISAKKDIVTFLTGEKIRVLAVEKSTKFYTLHYPCLPAPYSYAQRNFFEYNGSFDHFGSFDIDYFDEFSHKFFYIDTESEPERFEQLCSLKNADDKSKFDELARWYIEKYEIIEKIKVLFSQSHFLHNRRELFNTLLTHYEKGAFITFNYIVPLQIEGLFNDFCLALGINESTVDGKPLNDKLILIKEKMSFCYFYEYFAFKFPIIRNNVAHGRILNDNHKSLAQNLLLDFHSICEMFVSHHIPVMRSVSLLKDIKNSTDSKSDDLNNLLVKWFLYCAKTDIPTFYEADELKELCLARYESEEFWEWLNSIKKHGNMYFDSEDLKKLAIGLKTKRIAIKQCESFLTN